LKKQYLTLLALLVVATAITVGCGSSNSVPTFKQMAFYSTRTVTPATSLFYMNLDGSNITPVPFASSLWTPSNSADLKTIAFTSSGNVWVSNASGSVQTQLTTAGNSYFAKISPDGTKIVYSVWTGSFYQLWVMNVDGTGSLDLTSTMPTNMTSCFSGGFSADSKQIAFACWGSSIYGLYLVKADGTGTTIVLTQSSYLDAPSFTPDGKQILFVTYGAVGAKNQTTYNRPHFGSHGSPVAPNVASNQGIATVNLDGTNGSILIPNSYDVTVLNSNLYYTYWDSNLSLYQIYKANLDGTNPVSISDGTANDWVGISSGD